MSRRIGCRALTTLLAAAAGVVVLSGSDQSVTAHTYPRWQSLPAPPMAPRTHALGVRVGHRALVLGGSRPGAPALRDGASYDLRTGIWHHLRSPAALTDADTAVVAAGVVLIGHLGSGRPASWWRYDARPAAWSRLRHLPPHVHAPYAFGSEVYALSGRRVVVYNVQIGRWTPLPADPLRPALVDPAVSASRAGTVVTGHAHGRLVTDRWDGLRWSRSRTGTAAPVTAAPDGATRVRVGGRTLLVRGREAWIRLS